MKKVLIGCGIVLLLAFVACAGTGIYGYVKLKNFFAGIEESMTAMEDVNKEFPFEAPEDRVLDPARYADYLDARDAILIRVRQIRAFREVDAHLKKLEEDQASTLNLTAFTMLSSMAQFPSMVGDIANELKSREMSPAEFFFYSSETGNAIRRLGEKGDTEFRELWARVKGIAVDIDSVIAQDPNLSSYGVTLGDSLADLEYTEVSAANEALVQANRTRLVSDTIAIVLELISVQSIQSIQQASRPPAQGGSNAVSFSGPQLALAH